MEYLRNIFNLESFKRDKTSWVLFVCLSIVVPILYKQNENAHEYIKAEQEKSCNEMKEMLKESLKEYKISLEECINLVQLKDSIITVQNERLKIQNKINY